MTANLLAHLPNLFAAGIARRFGGAVCWGLGAGRSGLEGQTAKQRQQGAPLKHARPPAPIPQLCNSPLGQRQHLTRQSPVPHPQWRLQPHAEPPSNPHHHHPKPPVHADSTPNHPQPPNHPTPKPPVHADSTPNHPQPPKPQTPSGAYNRTLTPMGFQSEQRTLWQSPEVYARMSPFM